jgi:hypothetical protein
MVQQRQRGLLSVQMQTINIKPDGQQHTPIFLIKAFAVVFQESALQSSAANFKH